MPRESAIVATEQNGNLEAGGHQHGALEMFSPKFQFIQSIFYARIAVRILSVQAGKVHSDIFKFAADVVEEFDEVTLL
jgi:hypothetical protein